MLFAVYCEGCLSPEIREEINSGGPELNAERTCVFMELGKFLVLCG